MQPFKIWECLVCGWRYDESKGWPDDGIAPGTRWEDIPSDWQCPDCGVSKEDFEMVAVGTAPSAQEISSPIEPKAVAQDAQQVPFQIWECLVCGWIYDEAKGCPDEGIAPGTRWEAIPDDWACPDCGVGKEDFEMVAISRSDAGTEVPAESAAPTQTAETNDTDRKPVVIVGSGLAGYNLAKEFRKLDQRTPLVMITSDDGRFYSKPLISTGYHKQKSADEMATASAEKMAQQLDAAIHIFTRVTAIDPDAKRIETSNGNIDYEKLVLASGARCIEAPLEGNALNQVYSVNNLLDYARFRTAMVGKKRVLIIGAGLIGSEYCNDLIQSGFEVEVVDPLDSVLGTLLPQSASASVKNALEKAGARFHFGTVVKRVDQLGNGVRATLGNGSTIDADIVLSAIGVRPDLALAKMAGLETNRGIVTDRNLRTSNADIFALGDCAEVDGHVLFYITPLMESSRKLAATLYGTTSAVEYGVMPVTVKTTLFPVIVSPPAKQARGQWVIEEDNESGVRALFRSPTGELLGFALTGDCISDKDQLVAQTQPVMQTS